MVGRFIEDDLKAIFDPEAFASVAILDGSATIHGIFDNSSVDVNRDDDRRVVVNQATFTCPKSAGIVKGSILTIDEIDYKVEFPDDDGTGVVVWYMSKVR